MSQNSAPQELPTRVTHKGALQECPTRVACKSVPQECPTRVTHKSFLQECPTRVSHKSVPEESPTRVSYKSVIWTYACSFSNVFAFGFVFFFDSRERTLAEGGHHTLPSTKQLTTRMASSGRNIPAKAEQHKNEVVSGCKCAFWITALSACSNFWRRRPCRICSFCWPPPKRTNR